MSLHMTSYSARDTQAVGEGLGRVLQAGDVVCLYGELGSGKTMLTKGLALGLGVPQDHVVRSPSFVLIHEYKGRVPLYHADLFRLDTPADGEDIGLRELLGGDGVTVIEWADKLAAALPLERLDIVLQHADGDMRLITVQPRGKRYRRRLECWQNPLAHRPAPGCRGADAARMGTS